MPTEKSEILSSVKRLSIEQTTDVKGVGAERILNSTTGFLIIKGAKPAWRIVRFFAENATRQKGKRFLLKMQSRMSSQFKT